jgi:hypothetical protein
MKSRTERKRIREAKASLPKIDTDLHNARINVERLLDLRRATRIAAGLRTVPPIPVFSFPEPAPSRESTTGPRRSRDAWF